MTTQQRRSIRTALRRIHLWLGLTAGLLLAVIGLSGSALVFAEQIVRAEAPALFHDYGPGEWRPVSTWIEDAEKRFPELKPITYVFGPGTIPMPTGTPILFAQTERDGSERHTLIPVDPVKGTVLARIDAEDTWAGFLVIFHKELLARHWGVLITAICAVGGLLAMLIGIVLWWPRRGAWSTALRIKRSSASGVSIRDLHAVPAVLFYLPLSVALLSGLYMQKPGWLDPIVAVASPIRAIDPASLPASKPGACTGETTVDEALQLAEAGREDHILRHVFVPQGPQNVFQIELRAPDANPRATGTLVFVDRYCRRVLSMVSADDMTTGERIKALSWPLHTDLMLGRFGQLFVFLSGLLLAGLFVTGVMIWLRSNQTRNGI